MTKSELIDVLADSRGIPRRIAEQVVTIVFDEISETLIDGGRVEIRGFGTFKVRDYEGYLGHNPKTGAAIEVPPKRLPVFTVGKRLKAVVDTGARES